MYNQNIMLNNIINTVPDPIFVKDEKHTYQYVNQAFVQALGYSAEELLGKSDADFFSPKEHDVFYKMDCKTFKSEMTTTSEEKFTTKVLDTRVASTKKSIFKTLNDTKILVGVIRDITEISKARKVLEKHFQGLKRQVDIRTKQLKAKNDDLTLAIKTLKSLNSDLDCFAHMCCHELREPLRTISSFSKLAKDKFPGDVNGDMSLFLHEIYEGTLRMDKLIRAILDYSTNGLSNSVMSSFYPHELIAEVLTMLDTQMKEKNASIHFNEMPAIYADRLQIIQLFQNLISNATKFCAPLTRPVINITARPVNQFIEFKLTDKGIGIAKKYHKELFLPFKKFHSKSEGSMYGIGLSLCKKIIENHGGSIKISSRENMGTTFTFLLPSIERN
jgi:PAS domain S-box-containing protein